ncbi:hypothetical protein GALMADRAFT_274606 [Galerina marginata CBS 339.88]|uniref:Uncharacterized protein n=1 Tax=Galerina marginata (strain CBS 339.88) TaxID=685588 RepID=A0A067TRA6_GALM3|nr:hypothetical protein GALMADRAFT_274606 [Galerina marginata CBS 339.88]
MWVGGGAGAKTCWAMAIAARREVGWAYGATRIARHGGCSARGLVRCCICVNVVGRAISLSPRRAGREVGACAFGGVMLIIGLVTELGEGSRWIWKRGYQRTLGGMQMARAMDEIPDKSIARELDMYDRITTDHDG